MTLLELTVSLLVFGLVLGVIYGALLEVGGVVAQTTAQSAGNDQAQIAVQEVDRQIRSGNVLYNPADESDPANGIYPGMALVIYTQTDAPTSTPANRCVEWRVYDQQLQTRYWSPDWQDNGIVTAWQVVATDIVNQTVSPQVDAFTLSADSAYGDRLVEVDVLAQASGEATPSQVQSSVTGRDTLYGYPQSVCSDVPPGG